LRLVARSARAKCPRAAHGYRNKYWGTLPDEAARDKRLLLHLLHQIRSHLRRTGGGDREEPLFVSHVKADGDTTARAIVSYVSNICLGACRPDLSTTGTGRNRSAARCPANGSSHGF
jgi:hypothetical protein